MAYGKKNHIKVDLTNFCGGLIGESGIGKTTIAWEIFNKLLGVDGVLVGEFGKEQGADAIEGINYINIPTWSQEYDEATNSIGIEELVDHIIENKTTEYSDLKIFVVDTYDQFIEIAKEEVIDMHNREHPDKPVKSIKAAFGGYMAGEDKAVEIVLEKLWELKKVGVNFFIIGHIKNRTITDPVSGLEYNSVTTNMSLRDFNAIKTKLHYLGVATIDREIVKEKTGKKDKDKKEIMRNVIAKESRKITFRDDDYSIDSKSRFAEIVPQIPFDADEFIKALNDAIKAEQSKSGKSYEETKKEQEKTEAENLKKLAENEKNRKIVNNLKDEIVSFIKENKSDTSKILPLVEKSKELGYDNPVQVDKIADLIELKAVIDKM